MMMTVRLVYGADGVHKLWSEEERLRTQVRSLCRPPPVNGVSIRKCYSVQHMYKLTCESQLRDKNASLIHRLRLAL